MCDLSIAVWCMMMYFASFLDNKTRDEMDNVKAYRERLTRRVQPSQMSQFDITQSLKVCHEFRVSRLIVQNSLKLDHGITDPERTVEVYAV